MRYKSTPENTIYKSKFTQKLMRIKKAFDSSMYDDVIKSGWEATGFKINISDSDVSSFSFTEEFKAFFRAEASHQDPE